jgi:hypothetical protein
MWLPNKYCNWMDSIGAIVLALFLIGILGFIFVAAPIIMLYFLLFG